MVVFPSTDARRLNLAAGGIITYIGRTAHSEALIVSDAGYGVDHLDQLGASLSLSADIHPNVLNRSYGRPYLWARSADMGT